MWDLPGPGIQLSHVFSIGRCILYHWATREAPKLVNILSYLPQGLCPPTGKLTAVPSFQRVEVWVSYPQTARPNWASPSSFQIPLSKMQSLYVKNGDNRPCVLLSSTKVVLEKSLESPLDCKEIQPVHPKGNQSWIFTGRTDADTEAPMLWPPDAKSWLIGKDSDAGKDWG